MNNLATGKILNNENEPQMKWTNLGSKLSITRGAQGQTDKHLPGVSLIGFRHQVVAGLGLQGFFQP